MPRVRPYRNGRNGRRQFPGLRISRGYHRNTLDAGQVQIDRQNIVIPVCLAVDRKLDVQTVLCLPTQLATGPALCDVQLFRCAPLHVYAAQLAGDPGPVYVGLGGEHQASGLIHGPLWKAAGVLHGIVKFARPRGLVQQVALHSERVVLNLPLIAALGQAVPHQSLGLFRVYRHHFPLRPIVQMPYLVINLGPLPGLAAVAEKSLNSLGYVYRHVLPENLIGRRSRTTQQSDGRRRNQHRPHRPQSLPLRRAPLPL